MNKIYLEELTQKHAEKLYQFEQENKAYFASVGLPRPQSYYQKGSFLATLQILLLQQQTGVHTMYCIFDEAGELVGRLNLASMQDNTAEVGYRIAEKQQGKGYATKAVAQVIPLVKQKGFAKLAAGCNADNIPSQKVLLANGFCLVKKIPLAQMPEGSAVGGLWYQKLI